MAIPVAPVVLRLGRLGDTVLLQPLLAHLHARFGRPCLLFGRGDAGAALYAGHPDVGEAIGVDGPGWRLPLQPGYRRAVAALRHAHDAPILVAEPEPRSLLELRGRLRAAGVPDDRRVFLADRVGAADAHWVDRLLAFAAATPSAQASSDAGVDAAMPTSPRLVVHADDRADCSAWLARRDCDDRRLILLQPASKRTTRRLGPRGGGDDKWWRDARWATLARALLADCADGRVLLCGSNAERRYLAALAQRSGDPRILSVAGDLPLRRLMALLERARGSVSVDTGPAHVAAALGCPLVVLFGKVSPAHWTPRSADPSRVRVCGGPPARQCIDQVAVDEVIHAWRSLPMRERRPAR